MIRRLCATTALLLVPYVAEAQRIADNTWIESAPDGLVLYTLDRTERVTKAWRLATGETFPESPDYRGKFPRDGLAYPQLKQVNISRSNFRVLGAFQHLALVAENTPKNSRVLLATSASGDVRTKDFVLGREHALLTQWHRERQAKNLDVHVYADPNSDRFYVISGGTVSAVPRAQPLSAPTPVVTLGGLAISNFKFSPGGRYVALELRPEAEYTGRWLRVSNTARWRCFDLRSGKPVSGPDFGIRDDFYSDFSPDDRYLIVHQFTNWSREIWDLETQELVVALPPQVFAKYVDKPFVASLDDKLLYLIFTRSNQGEDLIARGQSSVAVLDWRNAGALVRSFPFSP